MPAWFRRRSPYTSRRAIRALESIAHSLEVVAAYAQTQLPFAPVADAPDLDTDVDVSYSSDADSYAFQERARRERFDDDRPARRLSSD